MKQNIQEESIELNFLILFLKGSLREYFEDINQKLGAGGYSRKTFLQSTKEFFDKLSKQITNLPKITTIEEFENIIKAFNNAINETRKVNGNDVIKELLKIWSEEQLEKQKSRATSDYGRIKAVESSSLGQIKGKGVENFIKNIFTTLNFERIKFIEAPVLDDLIGAADIYMVVQLENEVVVFAIDITGALDKSSSLIKLNKEDGNYPISLKILQQKIDVYRIEFALNDPNMKLSFEEIEGILKYAVRILKNDFLLNYFKRYKNDPRYKDGIGFKDFVDFLNSNLYDQYLKNILLGIFSFILLKNIILEAEYITKEDIIKLGNCVKIMDQELNKMQQVSGTVH